MPTICRIQFSLMAMTVALVTGCDAPRDTKNPNTPAGDGLVFTMKTQEKTLDGCIAGEDGCTYVRLDYPAILEAPDGTAVESISGAVLAFLGAPLGEDDPAGSPEALMDAFLKDYRDLKAHDPSYSHPWFLERKAFVLNNTPDVVSLSFVERSYTGGAHGMEVFHYENLDPHTGEALPLSSLFTDGYEEELLKLAETRFREVRGIAEGMTLTEAGFTFDHGVFALSEEFAIGEEGLIFHYNPYDVAPYALGPTEIVLSYDELAPLLK